ncbi:recombinase family protein [Eubacteriales bacterium OttesenSCG-928-A19]|nr:recombinase family protein [Eubacteriales bacterium OttesenSCG-928-A19]
MIFGYARCSTNETKQDIDRQVRELKKAGCEKIYLEYEHGDSAVKKELESLFSDIPMGGTIKATEVTRLTRSTRQLCELIERIKNQKLKLEILGSISVDCRNGEIDPMTTAFLQISGVFGELERAMTVSRVKSGLANAKAKGKKLGRPAISKDKLPAAFYKFYPDWKSGRLKKTEFSKLVGVGRDTLNRYIALVEK